MLVQLQPDQIVALWDVIKYAAIAGNSIKKTEQEKYSNEVLTNILVGKAQVWLCYSLDNGLKKVYDILITVHEKDEISETSSLLVHTIYPLFPNPSGLLEEALQQLVTYAKQVNLAKVFMLTSNSDLKEFFESQQFQTKYLSCLEL